MVPETPVEILCGSIVMFILGLAAGNYATSIVYRLPKGLRIANDPPYCECEKRIYLQMRDMFPFFSWLWNRRKCRFCGVSVQGLYAWVELGCGVLFIAGLLVYGISEQLILVLGLGVFLITLVALYVAQQCLYTLIVVLVVMFGALYRTLLDGSVYPFIKGGYLGLMTGIAVWGALCLVRRSRQPFPALAIMLAIGGLCVGISALGHFLLLTLLLWSVMRLAGAAVASLLTSADIIAPSLAMLLLVFRPNVLEAISQIAASVL